MRKLLIAIGLALATVSWLAAPAGAAPRPVEPGPQPTPTPGTPAQVCAYMTANPAVVGYLQAYYGHLHIDTYAGCVRVFAHGTPVVLDEVGQADGFGGDSYLRCADLEQNGDPGFGIPPISYPFLFAEPPELPLPWFTGANRAQCSRILFALHATAVAIGLPA
jgi:hypothetical protein